MSEPVTDAEVLSGPAVSDGSLQSALANHRVLVNEVVELTGLDPDVIEALLYIALNTAIFDLSGTAYPLVEEHAEQWLHMLIADYKLFGEGTPTEFTGLSTLLQDEGFLAALAAAEVEDGSGDDQPDA